MDLREITPDYYVAPQIGPHDVAQLKAAGITDVICNRPDMEVSAAENADTIKAAVTAAGLAFHDNPVTNGGLTEDMVALQAQVIQAATGPVFAYCRSGTRSTIVWALGQAGHRPTDEIIAAAAQGGYDLGHLRAQIDALAQRQG